LVLTDPDNSSAAALIEATRTLAGQISIQNLMTLPMA
jgi:hypothetical protein